MEYRTLGKTGVRIGRLGAMMFGKWGSCSTRHSVGSWKEDAGARLYR